MPNLHFNGDCEEALKLYEKAFDGRMTMLIRYKVSSACHPAYSGHRLNPVEKVWWALKGHICANRSFRTLVELDQAIRRFLDAFTPEDALCLANSPLTRAAQALAYVW